MEQKPMDDFHINWVSFWTDAHRTLKLDGYLKELGQLYTACCYYKKLLMCQ